MNYPRPQTPKNPRMRPIPPIAADDTNAGPTKYPANLRVSITVGISLVIVMLQKCALVWIECQRNFDIFRLVAAALYLLSIFNGYIPYAMKYKPYMTISCFRNILTAPFFYFYLLDYLVFLGIPVVSYLAGIYKWTNSDDSMYSEVALGCSICVLSSLAFVLVRSFPTVTHKPLEDSQSYLLTDSTQYSHETEKDLTILESTAFKIVITNIGEKPLTGPLMVKRTVTSRGATKSCGIEKEIISFTIKLDGPLDSDQQLILIPETHNAEGAVNVKNFRSFGRNRGLRVETEVVLGKRGNLSHVKEVSLYKFL